MRNRVFCRPGGFAALSQPVALLSFLSPHLPAFVNLPLAVFPVLYNGVPGSGGQQVPAPTGRENSSESDTSGPAAGLFRAGSVRVGPLPRRMACRNQSPQKALTQNTTKTL